MSVQARRALRSWRAPPARRGYDPPVTPLLLALPFGCADAEPVLEAPASVSTAELASLPPVLAERTPAQALRALDVVLAGGMPDPRDFMDLYAALYDAGAEPDCPGTDYDFNGVRVDVAGCETTEGSVYAGTAEHALTDGGGFTLHCDCRIEGADGRRVQGAGNLASSVVDMGGTGLMTTAELLGSFAAVGGAGWLEREPSAVLVVRAWEGGASLEGGITVAGESLVFDDLSFADCPLGAGAVEARDPSGGWFRWELEEGCTGCGGVSFGDDPAGQLCHDLTALYDAVQAIRVDP